jgi:diguanylate cyclase (GGDEF)-like protein
MSTPGTNVLSAAQTVILAESLAELTSTQDGKSAAVALIRGVIAVFETPQAGLFELDRVAGGLRLRPLVQSIGRHVQPVERFNDEPLLWQPADNPLKLLDMVDREVTGIIEGDIAEFRHVVPVRSCSGVNTLLLLERDNALCGDGQRLAAGIARIYANHLRMLNFGQRDALTGLLNRRTFDEHLSSRRRRLAIEGSYWIGVVDIDHFKQVNDRYGHVIGDEVLLSIARLLEASVRELDQVFRFGGEEFVIMLDAVPSKRAATVFERVRQSISTHRFQQVNQVTASLGYSRLVESQTPLDTLRQADEALYYAKNHGRNRVCSYESLTAAGELTQIKLAAGAVELF